MKVGSRFVSVSSIHYFRLALVDKMQVIAENTIVQWQNITYIADAAIKNLGQYSIVILEKPLTEICPINMQHQINLSVVYVSLLLLITASQWTHLSYFKEWALFQLLFVNLIPGTDMTWSSNHIYFENSLN